MRTLYIVLIFLLFEGEVNAQHPGLWAGNYKIKHDGIEYLVNVIQKDTEINATITAKSIGGYYNKYSCNCTVKANWYRENEDWLNCYIIKLLDGKNVLNPKPGEFLFSIINTHGSFYPFFRGYEPPTKFNASTPKFNKY